jgi:uncharacterized protein YeaO (DUF488 family)
MPLSAADGAAWKPDIRIKRAYEAADADDGARVLVDRIWPRGVAKESAALTLWLKAIAPTTALRKWFGHDPARWTEFRRRYRAELDANPAAVEELGRLVGAGRVTLVYAAHDRTHNHARVLAEFMNGAGGPRRTEEPH